MERADQQQKILALILIVLSFFISWFFLLKPAWEEKDRLAKTDAVQEKTLQKPSDWQESIDSEAEKLSLRVKQKSVSGVSLQGSLGNVLRFAESGEKNNMNIVIQKRGDVFNLFW